MSAQPNTLPTNAGQVSRDRLIRRAAHFYGNWGQSYPGKFWAEVDKLGITADETQEAIALSKAESEEHYGWCAIYGKPEYGGWKTDRRDGRHKPMDLIPREFWG